MVFPSRKLARWRQEAQKILERRRCLETFSDAEFLLKARELQWQVRSAGPVRKWLPDAYILGIEAARRALGLQHFAVQIIGAMALFEGHIAEMQTGEGKTLTATLPVIFRAWAGRGVHVITANDYLARRDAETMKPLYGLLGLSVGCVHQKMSDEERRAAYACDIAYGTASEIGFDFLRDRLKTGARPDGSSCPSIFAQEELEQVPVQRGHYFALIDEADYVLVDEARTPLIIGVMQKNREAMISLYRWCAHSISQLRPRQDFLFDLHRRQADLTEAGCLRVNLLSKPALLDSIDTETIYQHIEKGLTARLAFERNRDYVIHDDEIVIVDEGTGRKMDGRKWQAGLHQSIEAKERIPVTDTTGSAARITIQSFFRQYQHLAGMTGTAAQAQGEFRRVYKLPVCVIPTNRPSLRQGAPPRVFLSSHHKHNAIVQEVRRLIKDQRAVLIGTPSVEASESLAGRFQQEGISHTVLNARFLEQEAKIIFQAGQPGWVTIATNMAGRGTDIRLEEAVRQRGGLHVIATEMHTSRRIDRQLIGRAARQGDPGSYQFFLSLDDELLRALPPARREADRRYARPNSHGELDRRWLKIFQQVQQKLERFNLRQRKHLLKFEREQQKKFRRIGWDPYLESAEE